MKATPDEAAPAMGGSSHRNVEVAAPAILLVTDGYNKDWQASPLSGSVQTRYEVMPANYVLMGIPMAAGHHLLRLEYALPGFRLGL